MIVIDRTVAAEAYDRRPFGLGHEAHGDPLLTLEALVALAGTHPADAVEHNIGAVPVALPGGEAPRVELEPAQVLAEIAENGSWLVLKNVERDDRYRALLDRLLEEAANAPHWVQNGDEVSISLSITWRTRSTGRTGAVLAMNHRLRARGLHPHAPGTSRLADATKVTAHRALAVKERLTARRG